MGQIDEAIKKDKDFCVGAYMSKAWLTLKGKTRVFSKNERKSQYKN